jgi:hypothetical protein
MSIPIETRSIDIVKLLTRLEFQRDPVTGTLVTTAEYTTGFEDPELGYVPISKRATNFSAFESAWLVQRKPSEGGLTNPTLGQFLTVLFDNIELGNIALPEEPPLPPEEPDNG